MAADLCCLETSAVAVVAHEALALAVVDGHQPSTSEQTRDRQDGAVTRGHGVEDLAMAMANMPLMVTPGHHPPRDGPSGSRRPEQCTGRLTNPGVTVRLDSGLLSQAMRRSTDGRSPS